MIGESSAVPFGRKYPPQRYSPPFGSEIPVTSPVVLLKRMYEYPNTQFHS